MRLLVPFLSLCLAANPSVAGAQSCETTLVPTAPVIALSAPVLAAPVLAVPSSLAAAPLPDEGCDIEPGGGPEDPPDDPPPEDPPPPLPPPPANCPAQNVSWQVLLITYTAPLAALNHGQTGTATKTVLFVGICSADFLCTDGSLSQVGAGFCL